MPPRSRLHTRVRAFRRHVKTRYWKYRGVDPHFRIESLHLVKGSPQSIARFRKKIDSYMMREYPRKTSQLQAAQKELTELLSEKQLLEVAVGVDLSKGRFSKGLHWRLDEVNHQIPKAKNTFEYFHHIDHLTRMTYARPLLIKAALAASGIPIPRTSINPTISLLAKFIDKVYGTAVIQDVNKGLARGRSLVEFEDVREITGAKLKQFVRNYFTIARRVFLDETVFHGK